MFDTNVGFRKEVTTLMLALPR